MTTTVRLTGISKRYRGTAALDGIDLTFGPGITGLLGPNGAGKTTLLRIIATVLAPDEGGVHLLGRSPDTPETLAEVRRQLGYLPQEMGFPRGFTGFGFVDYMAVLKEWTERSSRHDEVRRVLGLVDLADVATKRVRALSGGQRRRVALAQALIGDPDTAAARRADHRRRPAAARLPAPRPLPGRGTLDGAVVHPPDRGRGRPVRPGRGPRPGKDPVRRRRHATSSPPPPAGSGWPTRRTPPRGPPGAPAPVSIAMWETSPRPVPSRPSPPWRTHTCC